MNNRTVRMIIMLGAFVIIGIFTVQIYWVQKAFNIQNKQFDQTVRINLSHVSDQLEVRTKSLDTFNKIEQLSSNYYILHVNGKIDTSHLRNLLVEEFANSKIKTDAEYAIYDSSTHKLLYGNFISHDGKINELQNHNLPLLQKGEYYVGIAFPGILFRMNSEMYIWIFSTVILLLFLLFFVYVLFVILKQKRLSEVQKDFVNNMTHEFKTPLSTISLVAETLGRSDNPDAQTASFANIIKDEASKLNAQVDKILFSSKSKSIRLLLKKEKLNVHDLIQSLVVNLKLKDSVQFIYQLDAENSIVIADRTYLSHALQNLLDNAVKYSGEGAKVIISTETKGNRLFLSVADNGIGIDSKFSKKIFEPFFRIPTGNLHNVRGFGIGLHYVKNIVSAHRWKLLLSSELNKGSKFTLQIPQ